MKDNSTTAVQAELAAFCARAEYKRARKHFAADVLRAERVSRGGSGIRSETAQHYWAAVLFTRIVVTAKSVQKLTPELEPEAHWDFSAVASITRNLAECYLFFYFLCVDNVSAVEKDARIILLDLHDYASREKLFAELGKEDSDEIKVAKTKTHNALVQQFNNNAYLSSLPPKRQKELIRGEKTPFVQDEVIDSTSMDKREFRFLYRFFSNHTHTGPVAFYRMAEHGRGRGFPNTSDALHKATALDFAGNLLKRATTDFLTFFPDSDTRGLAMEDGAAKTKPIPNRKSRRKKKS